MKKKNAFTLIELLAVIIIIGIIAILITPKVQSSIKDSKKSTYEISLHALEREADNFYLLKKSDNETFTGCTYDFTTNTNTCNGFEFKGEKPKSGTITIASNGFVSYALNFDKYCYMNYGQSEPIINDYNQETCKIEEPSSFETDSWKTISAAVKSNNTSKYNVGDTKEITLEGFGTHTVRIANMSTPEECRSQNFSQTACGFVVEFADIITTHRMNPYDANSEEPGNGNIGDWEYSEMRSYINNEIYNSFPEELKNSIIDTYVVSGLHLNSSNIFSTNDKLYLLAFSEIFNNQTYEKTNYSKVLDYYKEIHHISYYAKAYNSENNKYWWLRNAYIYDAPTAPKDSFEKMNASATPIPGTSTQGNGVSPAFRL